MLRHASRKMRLPGGRASAAATGIILVLAAASEAVRSQTIASSVSEIPVFVRWEDGPGPSRVNGPGGEPFEKHGSFFAGTVARPRSDLQFHDLEVAYADRDYPLRLRVHPQTDRVQVTVGLDRPRSCADVFLRKLEKPTLTATASVKAAFTLGYMIDGRAGENSCEDWPLRAAKARFDRYHNAMERSTTLAIPDGVKAAFRLAASSESERKRVAQIIAEGELAEKQRFASTLQHAVLGELKEGNVTAAFEASALLLETSKKEEYSSAVASQITPEALEKQTADLAERAGVEASAEVSTPE